MLMLALQIAEIIIQKFSDDFLMLFLKEGVYFAIDSLLKPEKRTTKLMYPVNCGIQPDFSQKSSSRQAIKCLCYAFSSGQSSTSSEVRKCKLDEYSAFDLAEHIKTTYFVRELFHSQTDALQNLTALSNDLLSMSTDNCALSVHEEKTKSILYQIMGKITGKEQVSTFEFIESGVLKSLADYLSQGRYMRNNNMGIHDVCKDNAVIEKRFETLASVCLFASQPFSCEKTLSLLIRNLHTALSSLETFPVIPSTGLKMRGSYVTVPKGRPVPYPSLYVNFVKAEGEKFRNDYFSGVGIIYTVDPFSSLQSIEGFLWPKLSSESIGYDGSSSILAPESPPPQSPLSSSTVPVEIPTDMMTDPPETQVIFVTMFLLHISCYLYETGFSLLCIILFLAFTVDLFSKIIILHLLTFYSVKIICFRIIFYYFVVILILPFLVVKLILPFLVFFYYTCSCVVTIVSHLKKYILLILLIYMLYIDKKYSMHFGMYAF